MMKVQELRIWNYVMCRGALSQVSIIKQQNIGYLKSSGAGEDSLPLKFVQPIPLTEEWLLKFGFERTDQKDNTNPDWIWLFYEKGLIYIDGSDYTIETASGIVVKLESVHQLQNLYFALTGEELTLKV